MINKVDFLGLVVDDVAEATRFYTETLGFNVDSEASIPNAYTQFALEGETIVGLLGGFEQEGITQNFDTGIEVENVDATYAELQRAGVELLGEPHDMPFGRTFLLRTPDGHVLRMYSPPSAN
ncbi:MAG: VOC family protein [Anaerolineae bacterium]|nr:VOC family protein [Anaerolineae bacterium]